jgi:RES domain
MTGSLPGASGDVPWPSAGVLRVHFEPAALPNLGDEPGANRFDDPRPRTVDRFLMRYAATTLRGCVLELLASLRGNAAAEERVTAVDVDDPNLVEAPAVTQWQHIADYLDGRMVATITARDLSMVSIDDPALQHQLNQEPAVRAVLDTPAARQALLPQKQSRVALDNAAVRLASEIGRYITQACALALFDRPSKPDAIHFRSRHDDAEGCWAIYDHAEVRIGAAEPLSPEEPAHAAALNAVAKLWDLPVPPAWRR